MDYKQIAKEVIEALGGRENVNSVAHCATRLRVMVKDENKINKEKAENIEKVQGAFFNSGQYQMIFGTGTVNKIYDEVVAQGLPTASKDEQKAEAAKQGNWFQRAIRSFGDVFVPLLPAIVATGLFMGIRGAINNDTVLALFGTTSKGEWVNAERLPSAPATSNTAAILAAIPVQIVATSLLMNCMVS